MMTKTKWTNKICLLSLGILLSGGVLLASCGGQKQKAATSNKAEATNVKHITAAQMKELVYDFDQHPTEFVYKGDKPAILDFYADWCGPCRKLSPKLEQLAEKYGDKLIVYKINVDNEQQLARHFGVSSIPMLLFVPIKGTPIQTMGDLPMESLEETLTQIMK